MQLKVQSAPQLPCPSLSVSTFVLGGGGCVDVLKSRPVESSSRPARSSENISLRYAVTLRFNCVKSYLALAALTDGIHQVVLHYEPTYTIDSRALLMVPRVESLASLVSGVAVNASPLLAAVLR